MFLATQVLPVCLSCFHCLFLIVTVLCLLTSWACWPTLGKVDKGSKHWTKQSPAFSLCSFSLSPPLSPLISHWLFIVPSSPPFSLFGGVSINIWRSRAAHWQREPIHPPSPSLFSRSLSFSLAQLLCMCACCCGSQIAHWGDAGSWLWSELTERGISVDLLSGLSRTPWQHLSLLLLLLITHSSFEVNFRVFFWYLIAEATHWSLRASVGIRIPILFVVRGVLPPPSVGEEFTGFGMTEILVSDVNLNSVCERLEQHCCVDQNQHNLSSQPQTPVHKRHSNTGAKLWGRVRSKLLRQKVSG